MLFGLFEAMTRIPFQTLPCWWMLYLRRVLDVMRRSWMEYGCPLLVQLSEHGSNARLTEGMHCVLRVHAISVLIRLPFAGEDGQP